MNFIKKIIDARIEKEYLSRKHEVEERLRLEESRLWSAYQNKINELNVLNSNLQMKIEEVKRTRENAEVEQKKLWERLDILRDNLNSEQVWMKVWECAFSKATDVVWGIMKAETVKLVTMAKEDGRSEVEIKLKETFQARLKEIEIGVGFNKPLLVERYEKCHNLFLIAERSKDELKKQYYKAQMELIDEIIK